MADKEDVLRICSDCVGESYLSSEIQSQGNHGRCSYCDEEGYCYTIEKMADRIEEVFSQHYRQTPQDPSDWEWHLLGDKESNYDWERAGEPTEDAIRNLGALPEPAAADIQELLENRYYDFDAAMCGEETAFSAGVHYDERPVDKRVWRAKWESFGRSMRTETRFFNRVAYKTLEDTFRGLEEMRTWKRKPVIVTIGPGKKLSKIYRARCCQSDEELRAVLARPDRELAPPPHHRARAGRMNPEGISVFYGANSPKAAIAEVRPPVGSRVAVARFEIIRPLRLLDLQVLRDVVCHGSLFDPEFGDRLERAAFLRKLTELIASPVLPDQERFEYLATQAIADFLATENSPPLDGIIFPSVQSGGTGRNLVLFHKAARVEEIVPPRGATLKVELGKWYEDGWDEEYFVTEKIPPDVKEVTEEDDFGLNFGDYEEESVLPITLRLDQESLRVHAVESLRLRTRDRGVHRLQWRLDRQEDESLDIAF